MRVLIVVDVPAPPLTSLTRWSAETYARARAAWRSQVEATAWATAAELAPALPASHEIVSTPAWGDPGRATGLHANTWGADLLVVGRDRGRGVERVLLGAGHDRAVATAACAVPVWPRLSTAGAGTTSRVGSECLSGPVLGPAPLA